MDEHIVADEMDAVEALISKLQEEKDLLQKRITKENIAKAFKEGRVAFKFDATTHRFYAFCMLWPTKDKYIYELGCIWVDKDSRRNGYAGEVFKHCMDILPKGAGVFLITREIEVLEIARNLGWQLERASWSRSEFWMNIAEPWDRIQPGRHAYGVLMFCLP